MASKTAFILGALVCLAALRVSAAENSDAEHGKQLYSRYCAVCHGSAGSGGLGPALKGVAGRLSPEQTQKQIVEPRAAMPRLYPNTISDADVRDILAYVLTL